MIGGEYNFKLGKWYKLRFENTPEGDAEGCDDFEMISECVTTSDSYVCFENETECIEFYQHQDGKWRDGNNWTILKSWEEIKNAATGEAAASES